MRPKWPKCASTADVHLNQKKLNPMDIKNFEFVLELTRNRITKDVMISLDIAEVLEPYSDSIRELIDLNDGNESMAINTMCHDFLGLKSNDEDFLPRLKLNNQLN
jgi:hypothetical protein